MKCPACRAEVPGSAAFCPACGAQVTSDVKKDSSATAKIAQPVAEGVTRPRLGPRGGADAPEQDLWQGGYSPKAMLGSWVVSGFITVACLIAPFLIASGSGWWLASFGIIALAWIVPALVLLYRRIGINYRVTNQRLFHESGILRRLTDRVELIDIDDVATDQGLFERMMGVGSIRITSSDRTHPVLILRGIEGVRQVAAQIDNGRRAERLRRGLHIETV